MLVSKWLNEKNAKFDNTLVSSKTQLSYLTRKRPLDVLEKALYECTRRYEDDIPISRALLQ